MKLIEQEKEYRIQEYWDRFGILRAPRVSIVDPSGFGVMAGNYSAYSKLVWSHKGNKAATNGSGKTPDQFSNWSSPHYQNMYINRYDDTEILFIILLYCMTFMYSFRYG